MAVLDWLVVSDPEFGAGTHQAELWRCRVGERVQLSIDGEQMVAISERGVPIGALQGPAARWLTTYPQVPGQSLAAQIHEIFGGTVEQPARRAFIRVWRVRQPISSGAITMTMSPQPLGTRDWEAVGYNALAAAPQTPTPPSPSQDEARR